MKEISQIKEPTTQFSQLKKSEAPLPVGWVVAAVGAAKVFAGYLLGQLVIPTIVDCIKHGVSPKQMIAFKISAWQRSNGMRGVSLCEWIKGKRGKNVNLVFIHPTTKAKLYLSALPNKNDPAFKKLIESEKEKEKEKIGAVFSINEPWEINHKIGVSDPYKPKDYKDSGIEYHQYAFKDHGLVQKDLLDKTSQDIERALKAKKDCIVHCRAGVGRSSQLIAGYLIQFHNMDADTAAQCIKNGYYNNNQHIEGRKQATIMNKLDNKVNKKTEVVLYGLRHYAKQVQAESDLLPKN